ncbi:hypothetical protein L484_012937 [Morus notabilis]|uniref:Uncharacterized protein n=1 Tax=Morus notabilis TaxID=981085 RepID=W9SBX2_9ROSA|nr:hypothetical protein L484_012937 [Morus notabilis]
MKGELREEGGVHSSVGICSRRRRVAGSISGTLLTTIYRQISLSSYNPPTNVLYFVFLYI